MRTLSTSCSNPWHNARTADKRTRRGPPDGVQNARSIPGAVSRSTTRALLGPRVARPTLVRRARTPVLIMLPVSSVDGLWRSTPGGSASGSIHSSRPQGAGPKSCFLKTTQSPVPPAADASTR
jgi:hypothetical protein